ncbi:hypothetical protein KFL_007720040 [Klebsormidium nitens]|uniref:Gfo/Idh/MocA-like oxidoreductase N-terminal domain-containing protein n=1 Tax=Klebsormidium nitens TaxID=105231 RepID=A0A1Y1IMK3_KLENI|nr:hypothetical protein KFL_007720040 [Klebsormidium nitens]|eukprot:GAQ91362.1 hypothetical protein KFL_007720040 [Klebsormidium nitens]
MATAERPTLALLGTGIFAKDAYLKFLGVLSGKFSLLYVWSRSEAGAVQFTGLVKDFAPGAKAVWGDQGLDTVFDSPVHAVAIVLPAQIQPALVARALQARKHVIQEKPVGVNAAHVLETLKVYKDLAAKLGPTTPIWAVAENYRFEPALLEAAQLVQQAGDMMAVQMTIETPMAKTNGYFPRPDKWRGDPAFTGTFFTDGAVHFVAGLRLISGQEVTSVSALASNVDKDFPWPDTLCGVAKLYNGAPCSILISYGARARNIRWRVIASNGTVEVERGSLDGKHGYTTRLFTPDGVKTEKFHPFSGVQDELDAFIADVQTAITKGSVSQHPRGSAVEGLKDLAVVEAALKSSINNGTWQKVDSIDQILYC